jgi:hypothetical protein
VGTLPATRISRLGPVTQLQHRTFTCSLDVHHPCSRLNSEARRACPLGEAFDFASELTPLGACRAQRRTMSVIRHNGFRPVNIGDMRHSRRIWKPERSKLVATREVASCCYTSVRKAAIALRRRSLPLNRNSSAFDRCRYLCGVRTAAGAISSKAPKCGLSSQLQRWATTRGLRDEQPRICEGPCRPERDDARPRVTVLSLQATRGRH